MDEANSSSKNKQEAESDLSALEGANNSANSSSLSDDERCVDATLIVLIVHVFIAKYLFALLLLHFTRYWYPVFCRPHTTVVLMLTLKEILQQQ